MLTLFDKLADELNVQIGHEFGAHTQYLALASYFEHRNLENLAHFFYAQAEEEKGARPQNCEAHQLRRW